MSGLVLPRRRLIARAGGLALSLPLLSACDAINDAPPVRKILSLGEKMHLASQRALTDRDALAREFGRADISPRSEEHTSELQSLMRISYAVFCLKQKNNATS